MKHSRASVGCVQVVYAYRGNNQLSPCAETLLNKKDLFSCVTNPTSFKGNNVFFFTVEKEATLECI